jgi:hypothetical protein
MDLHSSTLLVTLTRSASLIGTTRLPKQLVLVAALSSVAGLAGAQQEQAPGSQSVTPVPAPQAAPPAAQSGQMPTTDQPSAASPLTSVVTNPQPAPPLVNPVTDPQPAPPLVNPSVLAVLNAHDAGEHKSPKRKSRAFDQDSEMSPGDPWGDSQDELQAAGLSFRFLLQTHYTQTFANSSQNPNTDYRIGEEALVRDHDGWDLNRLFFRTDAEPARALGFKMTLDFSELKHSNPRQMIKQTYAELRPLRKRLHVQLGVLKLPFSIMELDPVAKYEFTSFGGANRLLRDLGFAGRDIGLQVLLAPLPRRKDLHLIAGVYHGHAQDDQGMLLGAVAARAETEPFKGVRFGADWVAHPSTVQYVAYAYTGNKSELPNPANPNMPITERWDSGRAYSADVTFSRSRLMLRAEGMLGNRVDHYTQYGAKNFAAFWALAAYRFPVGTVDLMPAIRAEWLDTDTEHTDGLRRQLTLGLSTYFTKSIRLLFDVTRTDVQSGTPIVDQPLPLQMQPYLALSNTRVSGQLQFDL